MIEIPQIDIGPVLQAVETLLKTTLVITLGVAICGMVASILCSLLGDQDEE